MNTSQSRQPKGQPVGGQFASKQQSNDEVDGLSPEASGVAARDLAAGQLAGLTHGHVCGLACTGTGIRGDGSTVQLQCPYKRLDVTDPVDQKIIGSLYANHVRAAMGRVW